jgi:uncharacterized C2H2 Zn-finger protein
MPDTLLATLKKLARQKHGLKDRERLVATEERRLVKNLSRVLPSIGYRLVPVSGAAPKVGAMTGARRIKRLRCPKCDRRFAHPLPLARHLSATHGAKKNIKKTKRRPRKTPPK